MLWPGILALTPPRLLARDFVHELCEPLHVADALAISACVGATMLSVVIGISTLIAFVTVFDTMTPVLERVAGLRAQMGAWTVIAAHV